MKALFGMVSLLVAVAVIGVLVSRQLKATGQSSGIAASAPGTAQGGTITDQSRQLQEKARRDVVEALEQGARRNESDQ